MLYFNESVKCPPIVAISSQMRLSFFVWCARKKKAHQKTRNGNLAFTKVLKYVIHHAHISHYEVYIIMILILSKFCWFLRYCPITHLQTHDFFE